MYHNCTILYYAFAIFKHVYYTTVYHYYETMLECCMMYYTSLYLQTLLFVYLISS